MLVNVRTVAVDERGQRSQIPAGVEPCLPGNLDAGSIEERNRVEKRYLESEIACDCGFLPQAIRLFLSISVQRCELVPGHPVPVAIDRLVLDDGVDLGDRREARVPRRLSVIASEI